MPAQIGALRVTLGANTAQFEQGMRRAQATARSTGQNIERSMSGLSLRTSQAFAGIRVAAAGLGVALGASFLIQQTRAAFDFAAGLSETARSIGVTVEQLQILQRAAIENGASMEGMERAVSILNRTLGQARAGVPAAVQAFRALRIDPQQFTNAGEVLPRVMDAIHNLATESEQAAAAQRLMGRGAAEMLPFLVQGAEGYNLVADAARRAGLLTEEQAQRADEAKDRLDLLAYSLRTNLAGALVEILPAIESVISGLGRMATAASDALSWLGRIGGSRAGVSLATTAVQQLASNPATAWIIPLIGVGMAGSSSSDSFDIPIHDIPSTNTGNRDLDLSPHRGGGGRGAAARAEAERKRRLREDAEFESEMRRQRIDALRAQQDQSQDFAPRYDVEQQIVRIELEEYAARQQLAVNLGEQTRERAIQLIAQRRETAFQRLAADNQELDANTARARQELADQQYDLASTALRQQEDLVDTAEERRRIELELLELTYRHQRAKLEAVIAEEAAGRATREAGIEARRELAALNAGQGNQRAAVLRSTRGPLEEYFASLPTTAARAREALQGVAVEGFQGIADGLAQVIAGTRKWGDVFKDVAQRIIADLIKIQIEQKLIPLLANLIPGLGSLGGGGTVSPSSWESVVSTVGSLPGRAIGGPVLPGRAYVVGERGPEILRMGMGGGTIVPNNATGGGGIIINQTFAPNIAGNAPTRAEMVFLAAQAKQDTLVAVREINRRRSR